LSVVRILLVEDFVPWHQVVRSLLQENPELQVIGEATNGLEAVGKAIELQPDLVLLDIGLPGVNGIEVAHHISRVSPRSKILFLTEMDSRAVIQRAVRKGAHGYVLKSDAVRQLLPAVEAVMAGQQFVGPEIDADIAAGTSTTRPKLV
jgi:DNA-binding NarL/FixJ family response regulator